LFYFYIKEIVCEDTDNLMLEKGYSVFILAVILRRITIFLDGIYCIIKKYKLKKFDVVGVDLPFSSMS